MFWSSKSSSEISGVPEDSNPNFFQVLGFTPHLAKVGLRQGGWDEIIMYIENAKKERNEVYVDSGRAMATVSI